MNDSKVNRDTVRQRAKNKCEYCLLPDAIGKFSHQVDHIIPVKQNGSSELDNLAWACFDCNVYKGISIASYDNETGELTPLYNPRKQSWQEHFNFNGALIEGKTAIGRVTIFVLRMNHPDRVEMRQYLIEAGLW